LSCYRPLEPHHCILSCYRPPATSLYLIQLLIDLLCY
jgi:hypothetical protein